MDNKHVETESNSPAVGVISPRRRGSEPRSPTSGGFLGVPHAKTDVPTDESLSARRSLGQPAAADVEHTLSQRGLHFIRREEKEPSQQRPDLSLLQIDEKGEQQIVHDLLKEAIEKGYKTHLAAPFVAPIGNVTPAIHHAGQVFAFSLRYNSRYPEAKVILIDFTKKTVQYIGHQRIIKEKAILGSRCQADLIVKWKFHIWFKEDKAPIEHSTYDENYRDIIVELMNMKETPKVEFPVIHHGPATKRGKSGFTSNPRYLRLVHGQLFIYRSEGTHYPNDALCLIGLRIDPKSSTSIRIHSEEREIFLKFPTQKERDMWMAAMKLAKERGEHERQLLTKHNKLIAASSSAGHRHRGKKKRLKSPSRSALDRGYARSLDPNFDDDVSSVGSDDTSMSDLDIRSPRNANGFPRSRSIPNNLSSEFPGDHKIVSIPEDDERKRERNSVKNVYTGGPGEFEVRVVGHDSTQSAIGFIEVESDVTLDKFRRRIVEELDNVPKDFQFLRQGAPVGRRQELSKTIQFIVLDNTVLLRATPKSENPT